MRENYNVSENSLDMTYFRSPLKIALSFFLLGSAFTLSHAQNLRAAENPLALAKLSYNEQYNQAALKMTPSPVIKTTSKGVPALNGVYTVGVGGNFTTLSAAVASFNASPITGPVTFSLLDSTYPSETFPIVINANAGSSATNTLTIKPAAGVDATISGSAPVLLKINGADYVTVDGSNNGSGSDNLVLNNTYPTGADLPVLAWVASTATDGADYVTLKNIKFLGFDPSNTIAGVLVSGPTLGGAGTIPNNYLKVESNTFNRAQNAMFVIGLATNQDDGAVIKDNTIGSSNPLERMGFRGIAVQNAKNVMISGNMINGVSTSSTSTSSGILVGATINNITVTGNQINDVSNTNTGGYGSNGIYSNAAAGSTNVLISNNFVSNIYSYGYPSLGGVGDNGLGIAVGGAGTDIRIYNNTVSLNTNQTVAGRPAALNILSGVVAGAVDVRNNILANNQTTSGERYAIYSGAANTAFAKIDYNNYSTTGANLGYIGSARSNLAAVQAGFGSNLKSLNVTPVFTSGTDLHMTAANSALDNKGTPLLDVTVDIDGAARSATKPDMGADEFKASLAGTYTVGSTGDYASLTNPGGVFDELNLSGATGNVTFDITEDLTAETGANPLNPIVGGYTVTIKPSGAARVISGTMASNALIRTAGASGVTIDGSLSGGTDRSLSITNLSVTAPQVVRFGSVGTATMSNNTLKNTIITNGINTSTAVVIHDNALAATAGYFNNITIKNNVIKKAYMAVYAASAAVAGNGGITVSDNDLSTAGADAIALAGIYGQGLDGAVIQNNTIGNFNATGAYARRGIWLATGAVNSVVSGNTISNINSGAAAGSGAVGILVSSTNGGYKLNTNNSIDNNSITNVSSASTSIVAGIQLLGSSATVSTSGVSLTRNKITNIKNSNSGGYASVGIYLNGYSVAANGGVNVMNNFISDVANYGYNGTSYLDNGVGITFNGVSTGYKIYNNTINMATNQTIPGMTAAINVPSSITGAGAIDLRNNILVNSQTTSTRYAVYSAVPNTVFSNIDNNDYYSTGSVGYLGGSARATLADWQTATGKDVNSLNVLPEFMSPTDLHLTIANTALDNKGTALAEVTIDIDGDARSATTPDMGADEFSIATAATENVKAGVKIYPNPVVDYVNINNSSKIESVEVYNVTGQKVSSKTWNANSGTVDMRSMTPGMYIITVKSGKDVHTVKIIKK